MKNRHDAEFDKWLVGSGYRVAVPDGLQARIVQKGNDLMDKAPQRRRTNRISSRGRTVAIWTGVPIAAAGLIIVCALILSHSSHAWAESISALRTRSWIHITATSDNIVHEGWISPVMGVVAGRNDDVLEFDDLHMSEAFTYQKSTKQLVRVPLTDHRKHLIDGRSLVAVLSQIEVTPQEFLAVFWQDDAENLREIDQSSRKVVDAAGTWRELKCNFAVLPNVGTDRLSATMRFESKTGTLRTVDLEMDVTLPKLRQRNQRSIRLEFDYPEDGPRDIYALGVPAKTKLVDRGPEPDVDTILRGFRTVPERFDDYLCYVIDTPESCKWYNGRPLFRVWKKGKRWRVDGMVVASEPDLIREEPDIEDIHEWWKERAPKYRYFPWARCDGEKVYRYTLNHSKESSVTGLEVASIEEEPAPVIAEHPMYWGQRPEWWSHPPLGIPHAALKHTYCHPASKGSANTGLLDIQRDGPVTADQYERMQYWIDPNRSFVTMRHEFHGVEALFDDSYSQAQLRRMIITPDMPRASIWSEVKSLAQSPRGYWYPTEIWIHAPYRGRHKQQRFVLQFPERIDDAIFHPDTPTHP